MNDNIRFYIHAELNMNCQWIKLGNKPLAIVQLQRRYKELVIKYLNEFHPTILYQIEITNDEWLKVILYQYNHMKLIYDYLPNEPNSIFDHWLIGKACGYSDEAIEQYLIKNDYI